MTDPRTFPRLPRLARLRKDLLDAPYGLCTTKAELLTDFFREHERWDPLLDGLPRLHYRLARRALARNLGSGRPQKPWQLRLGNGLQRAYTRREATIRQKPPVVLFAQALVHILREAPLRVYADELVVGNPSSRRIGAPIHPDLGGLLMLPELDTLSTREVNPLEVSPEQKRLLAAKIFPFWFPRSVMSRAQTLSRDPELPNVLTRGRDFVLTQFAGISHVTPDYPVVLEKGFTGLLVEAQEARRSARNAEKKALYQAMGIVAQAAIDFGERWSRFLESKAQAEDDTARAAELRELSEILARVPAHPARTFHEAVQSVFLTHVIVHQESFQHGVSFGRVDQYLHPYYERDVAEGRITREEAVEILGCFLGKAAELLPLFNRMATEYFSGLSSASGITLGGVDEEGHDASNETTFLLLEAYDQMRLRQPNLHMRVHPESPPALLARSHEVIKGGGGMPALFNDSAIVPALEKLSVDPVDARDYSIVGCVEWGVPRKSFPAAGACFLSLPAVLDRALHREDAWASMDALCSTFDDELADTVRAAAEGNDAIERAHALHRPTPLLSILVQGCLGSGVEVNAGGARYSGTGMQGVGVADVADSLAAIERLVFEEKRLPLRELVAAADADFEGHEALLRRIQDRVPKFGADEGRAEAWASRTVDSFCGRVGARRNPRGGSYVPGFWTMTTHVGFGRRLGALPSGRRAGQPLADGISPANGCDNRGPTASMMAAARASSRRVGNGLCLNEKLDPCYLRGEGGTQLMVGLSRGYFGAGGMHVQYNVVDRAVLIDAKAHPERHRDLVVRISGYSAYFNDLTEEMKDDIIARALHGLGPRGPACSDVRGTGE